MEGRLQNSRQFWSRAARRQTARRTAWIDLVRSFAFGLVSLVLTIGPTTEVSASPLPAAMKGAAIAVCNMIRDAKSVDQVHDIVNGADALSAKLEKDLADVNSKMPAAKALELETWKAFQAKNYSLFLQGEHDDASRDVAQLQLQADDIGNSLTALTFAGFAIVGCAEAKIAKLEQKPTPTEQEPAASPVNPTPPEQEAAAPPAPNVPTGPVCDQVAYDTARKAYIAAKHAKYPKGYAVGAEAVWAEKNDPMSDNLSAVNVFINGAKTGDYGELCDLYRRGAAIYNAHVVTPEAVP